MSGSRFCYRVETGILGMLEKTISPLIVCIVIGIGIRLILAPYTFNLYDFPFWAETAFSIENGLTMYSSGTFWYPPVWGYLLTSLSGVLNIFDIVPYDMLFPEIIPGEFEIGRGTITVPAFNLVVKLPLILADLAAGLVIYKIVEHLTGSVKRSSLAFAVWMLCPLTIMISSVHGQIEPLSILFMVGALFFMLKGKYFFAGMAMSLSIFTKVFPGLLVPIMIGYILSKGADPETRRSDVLAFIMGLAFMSILIALPMILMGEGSEIFNFLTGRLDYTSTSHGLEFSTIFSPWNLTYFMPFVIAISLYLGYRMYRTGTDHDNRLFELSALVMCSLFIWLFAPPQNQYILFLVPLLAILYCTGKIPLNMLLVIAALGFIGDVVGDGIASLYPLGAYTNFVSLDWMVDVFWITKPICMVFDYVLKGGLITITAIWIFCHISGKDIRFWRKSNAESC